MVSCEVHRASLLADLLRSACSPGFIFRRWLPPRGGRTSCSSSPTTRAMATSVLTATPRSRRRTSTGSRRESVWLKNFYVSPVCSPTRASLLTGRYNYRTGVVDTYLGRALMHPDEVTLAEMLAGGRLSDRHLRQVAPGRQRAAAADRPGVPGVARDQGRRHRPGVRPAGRQQLLRPDPPAQRQAPSGSRVIAATSSPTPRSISCRHRRPARSSPTSPSTARTSRLRRPRPSWRPTRRWTCRSSRSRSSASRSRPTWRRRPRTVARVYAMVTNIDTNVGRVLKALEDRKLADNTIVVFLTDNGPAEVRFNAGLRGWKGSVYDGGIRVPCYLRWPGHFPAGLGRRPDRRPYRSDADVARRLRRAGCPRT